MNICICWSRDVFSATHLSLSKQIVVRIKQQTCFQLFLPFIRVKSKTKYKYKVQAQVAPIAFSVVMTYNGAISVLSWWMQNQHYQMELIGNFLNDRVTEEPNHWTLGDFLHHVFSKQL